MYRQHYNEYEKKAEQIRMAASEIPIPQKPLPVIERPAAPPKPKNHDKGFLNGFFEKFALDDVILIALILLLLQEDEPDTMLLLVLGYIFISDF